MKLDGAGLVAASEKSERQYQALMERVVVVEAVLAQALEWVPEPERTQFERAAFRDFHARTDDD